MDRDLVEQYLDDIASCCKELRKKSKTPDELMEAGTRLAETAEMVLS